LRSTSTAGELLQNIGEMASVRVSPEDSTPVAGQDEQDGDDEQDDDEELAREFCAHVLITTQMAEGDEKLYLPPAWLNRFI